MNGARDLAEHVADSPYATRGFVSQLFSHLVKQPVGAYGEDVLDELVAHFVKADYNIRSLVVEIATVAACYDSGIKEK